MPSFYEVLEVTPDAPDDEIKRAYRKLTLQYHPDRNIGNADATAKIQEINLAYETLKDPAQRKEYDDKLNGNPGGNANDVNDIFRAFFQGGGGFGQQQQGFHIFHGGNGGIGINIQQLHQMHQQHMQQQMERPPLVVKNVQITLGQSYTGCDIVFSAETHNKISGITATNAINVSIPKGTVHNQILLVQGFGHVISDTVKGDIKLIIEVGTHPMFTRNGLDLVCNKSLTLKESLCGFTFELEHLNGNTLSFNNLLNVEIVKPGQTKIIPNLGFTNVGGGQVGNLVINFSIDYPVLTQEQIEGLTAIL